MFPFYLLAQTADTYALSADSFVNHYASQNRIYEAIRINVQPKIDGELDDPCWETGTWFDDFIQQKPVQAGKPSQRTEFKILYDDDNIFVAFRCFDNQPDEIQSALIRRDNFSGDRVGIAFDSFFDKQTAFEFNVTAAGQKIDLLHQGAFRTDRNWDAVWDGKAVIHDSIWTVEMQIPFSQLRFSRQEEQIWGLHVVRWIERLNEENQWKLVPVDAPAMVYLFGELHGINNILPKRKTELLPYTRTGFRSDYADKGKIDSGFGLDGKIGLSSDFTLDMSFNPDFGQVEADPAVLNLTSYEVFYDEKRPFFLEGSAVFDYTTGTDKIFYSRRIGHAPVYNPDVNEGETLLIPLNASILGALKLTGKNKSGFSLGVMESLTSREKATIRAVSDQKSVAVEPLTNYFVGRVKQDMNGGNTIVGGMLVSTIRDIRDEHLDFLPSTSHVTGIDFQHNWKNRKYFIEAKGFVSQVKGSGEAVRLLQLSPVHNFQRPDARHLSVDSLSTIMTGHGGVVNGGKRSGKFRLNGTLDWRSPGLELNDIGYLRRGDLITGMIDLNYNVNRPIGILQNYELELGHRHEWSFGGENLLDRIDFEFYSRFINLWSVRLNSSYKFNILDTRLLRGGPALYIDDNWGGDFNLQTNTTKDLTFRLTGGWQLWRDGISSEKYTGLYSRWRLNDGMSLAADIRGFSSSDNNIYVGQAKDNSGSAHYLVGLINQKTLETTLRLDYFITPDLSVQFYGNPYTSIGKYSNFREVKNGSNRQSELRYTTVEILDEKSGKFTFDSDKDRISDFSLKKPDFTFGEFHSNLVVRWEYRPGSTVYVFWSNARSFREPNYHDSISESFEKIWDTKTQNLFMLKFSYWISS